VVLTQVLIAGFLFYAHRKKWLIGPEVVSSDANKSSSKDRSQDEKEGADLSDAQSSDASSTAGHKGRDSGSDADHVSSGSEHLDSRRRH